MSTSRSPKDLVAAYCEPPNPPPYWWRRAEENRLTMTLTLVADEPERLDPRDLVADGDETWPPGRVATATGKS